MNIKFRPYRRLAHMALALLAAVSSCNSLAELWQDTNVSVGYTDKGKVDPVFGTGAPDSKVTTTRLEHFGGWAYGNNYFSIDNYSGHSVGNIPGYPSAGSFGDNTPNQQLIIYIPRLSVPKIAGLKFGNSLIKDVYLSGRFERGSYSNFAADNFGVGVELNVPEGALLITDVFYRTYRFTGSTASGGNLFWQTYGFTPLQVGSLRMNFSALVLVNKRRDAVGTDIYVEPDLMIPLGASGLEVGYRHLYHKFNGYSRSSPTLLAKWHF